MKKSTFAKGTLIGGLVGLAAGILFAPKSGKETREQIKTTAQRGAADVRQRLDRLGDEVAKHIDMVKTAAKELTGEAKTESQELMARSETFRKDLKAAVADLAGTGKVAKDQAAEHAAKLLDEGQAIVTEAKRVSRYVAKSTKTKLRGSRS